MSAVESMTGFASVDGTLPNGRSFTLTLKSVNHRHLDLSIRLPGALDSLEATLRKAVKSSVKRGHVELTLMLEKGGAAPVPEVDEALLGAYVSAFVRSAAKLGLPQEPDLNGMFRLPGVLTTAAATLNAVEMEAPALAALDRVLEQFHCARQMEGAALAAELQACMTRIGTLAEEARTLRAGVAAAEFQKLSVRLAELLGSAEVPQERLLAEAAMLAARGDVEEELVRLRTHVQRFMVLLGAGGEAGRPLDFLLQELNREANTLLSKTGANCGEGGLRLTEIGLAVKMELERAREQVQNLE